LPAKRGISTSAEIAFLGWFTLGITLGGESNVCGAVIVLFGVIFFISLCSLTLPVRG
jgi:hypothetical protein